MSFVRRSDEPLKMHTSANLHTLRDSVVNSF